MSAARRVRFLCIASVWIRYAEIPEIGKSINQLLESRFRDALRGDEHRIRCAILEHHVDHVGLDRRSFFSVFARTQLVKTQRSNVRSAKVARLSSNKLRN